MRHNLLAFLISTQIIMLCLNNAQAWIVSLNTEQIDSIPFVLNDHNNITIKVLLNSTDTLNLMFHTAANDIALTEECVKDLRAFSLDGSDSVNSWGGKHEARWSTGNSIQIGSGSIGNLNIWVDERSGPGTDGKFGPNLFKDKIIEIDYDQNMIFLHTELPEIDSLWNKSLLEIENGLWFINTTSIINEERYQNRFLIHSGYGGTLLYDDAFVLKNRFSDRLEIVKESDLKDSFGNSIKTKRAIMPEVLISQFQFENISIGFFEGSIGRQTMSVLGADILKRFNILFDEKNSTIYLKKSSLYNTPFSDL